MATVCKMPISAFRNRYGELVDKKFSVGLTESERRELQSLYRMLELFDTRYYAPTKRLLRNVIKGL
jgi:hypothetical protein